MGIWVWSLSECISHCKNKLCLENRFYFLERKYIARTLIWQEGNFIKYAILVLEWKNRANRRKAWVVHTNAYRIQVQNDLIFRLNKGSSEHWFSKCFSFWWGYIPEKIFLQTSFSLILPLVIYSGSMLFSCPIKVSAEISWAGQSEDFFIPSICQLVVTYSILSLHILFPPSIINLLMLIPSFLTYLRGAVFMLKHFIIYESKQRELLEHVENYF